VKKGGKFSLNQVSLRSKLTYNVDVNFGHVIKTGCSWQHSDTPARNGQVGEEVYWANCQNR